MPTKIELLRQAGFSTEQIVDWAYNERLKMRAEGRNDDEIDREFGIARSPEAAQAPFLRRLKNGLVFQRMIDAAKDHWNRNVGDDPIESSLQNWDFLRAFGPPGHVAGTAAAELELAAKGASGVLGGIGAALGQGLEEAFGPGNRPKGTAARDAALMAELIPSFYGATGPMRAASIGGSLRAVPDRFASGVPRAREFQTAAASITGTSYSSDMEQRLLQLWHEFGAHPLDVASEVSRNPSIAQAVKSGSVRWASRTVPAEARLEPGLEVVPVGASGTTRGVGDTESPGAAVWPRGMIEDAVPVPDNSISGVHQEVRGRVGATFIDPRDPPSVPARPFARDYPTSPRTDAAGRLLEDIEGRDLKAKFITGRRNIGAADVGLTPKEVRQVARAAGIEVNLERLPEEQGGFYLPLSSDNTKRRIFINDAVLKADRPRIEAHELGHAIDDLIGWASSRIESGSKEMHQLRMVFGRSRTDDAEKWFAWQPERFGYPKHQIKTELLGDGLGVYLAHPNFFKTVAPDAARLIRELVNEHPVLSKIIQFNSIAGAGLLGARPAHDDAHQ